MSEAHVAPAREAALEVLMQMANANAWSDAGLKKILARHHLDSRDAALATRLCYGVLQNRMLLEHYVGCFCTQRPAHLETVVRQVLYLGAYQLLFMDRIPVHAAVNDSVEQVRRHGRPKAAGLVNAVLRKLAANRHALPPLPEGDAAQTLSLRYSHPLWMVERFLSLLGAQECEALLRCDNELAPMTVQTNTLRLTPAELTEKLQREGVSAQPHPWLEGCLILQGTGDLERLESFRAGDFTVQDAGARLVALAARDGEQERVLDVCAAPGGKSFALAIDRGDRGQILACDIYPHKVKLLSSGAARLGLRSVQPMLADGRERHAAWVGQADLVVADVPCSGLGIIRKKPDIRYKDPSALAALPALQRAILDNAAAYVRPGGLLVYSTCTVLPEENEGVTEAFLHDHTQFAEEPFTLPGPVGQTAGHVTLWPHRTGTDGFYICRMRRKNEETL